MNRSQSSTRFAVGIYLTLALSLTAFAAPVPAEEAAELPLRFRISAMSTGSRSGTARLDLSITRWSTEAERTELLEALAEGQSRSLPDGLNSQERVGEVREVGSLGEVLRYSRRIPTENGEQIILATDRPIAFVESWNRSRTRDYNVTVIHLTLDDEGNGEGTLMLGAELSLDAETGQLTVEHMSNQPVRLTNVRLR